MTTEKYARDGLLGGLYPRHFCLFVCLFVLLVYKLDENGWRVSSERCFEKNF